MPPLRRRPDVRPAVPSPGAARPRPVAHRAALPTVLAAVTLLVSAACGSDADAGVDPSAADWPAAVSPAEADGDVWAVWTAVDASADAEALTAEVARLDQQGYDVEPVDPACQEGAHEQLAALTGIAEPVAVGVLFASEEDAGVFDTRDEGTTVSVTSGAWTC
ncbi:hypothetical protein [Cellulomonas iranensis]|uniref:hypothetical protein n=1 Tax=Cellulomonas iranensis TaxID=76862 RepID=UPI0013D7BEDE|nr:hypothetical protein [Cellulomonas iranensis]